MQKTLCPRCGQDWVRMAAIVPLNEPIRICPECDAFWKLDQEVRGDNFTDYETYLEARGYANGWSHLQILDE